MAKKTDKTMPTKVTRPIEPSPSITARLVAQIVEHPQLLTVAAATVGAGIVTRRGDLVRGGARTLAIILAGAAIRTAIGRGLDSPIVEGERDAEAAPSASRHLSDAVVGGVTGWAAEALVDAVFEHIEPAIEHRVAREKGRGGKRH